GPGKALFSPVHPTGREQFLGSQYPEKFLQLRSDQVLPSVPTGHGEVDGPGLFSIGEMGYQIGVFVIGMGRDIEGGSQKIQFFQVMVYLGRAGFFWLLRIDFGKKEADGNKKGPESSHVNFFFQSPNIKRFTP